MSRGFLNFFSGTNSPGGTGGAGALPVKGRRNSEIARFGFVLPPAAAFAFTPAPRPPP